MMNLDVLQTEVEKLLSLLKDRQRGLISWNTALEDRLRTIQSLIDSCGITANNKEDSL